jgi:prevent-host-death family protein
VKSIEEAEAQERFAELVSEVQREPIVIRRQAREMAVVLSMAQYDRLRDGAVRGFLEIRESVAREAANAGLTERRLLDLLDRE